VQQQQRSIDRLLDVESIKQTKYAYLRCIDQKDFAGLGDLLAEDATAAYSGGRYLYEGRAAIVGFIETNMSRTTMLSSHRVQQPEITVTGDEARGTWALSDTIVDTEWNFVLQGAAFYEDRYVRSGDRWLISHTGYRRTFEFILPTADLAGFRVTASWWGSDGQSSLSVQ